MTVAVKIWFLFTFLYVMQNKTNFHMFHEDLLSKSQSLAGPWPYLGCGRTNLYSKLTWLLALLPWHYPWSFLSLAAWKSKVVCKESLHVRLLDTGIQKWQFVIHDLICNGGEILLPVLQTLNTGIFMGHVCTNRYRTCYTNKQQQLTTAKNQCFFNL